MIQPTSATWETTKKAPHFPCPHCGKQLRHDTSKIGQRVMCPGCRQAFVLHRLSAQFHQTENNRLQNHPQSRQTTETANSKTEEGLKPVLNYRAAPKRKRQIKIEKWMIILTTCACHILILFWGIAYLKNKQQEQKRLAAQANQASSVSSPYYQQRNTSSTPSAQPNFMEKVVDVVTGRSIEDKILGKWEEIDGPEKIEFFPDGNAILTHPMTNYQPLAVDYKFINKECSKIRINILHIPVAFSVEINKDILKLEAGPGPNQFSYYRRVSG